MADKPVIVDAQSVSTPAQFMPNIPVRINTDQVTQNIQEQMNKTLQSQLGKAIQEIATKAMSTAAIPGVQTMSPTNVSAERINPSTFMRDMTAEMERLYQRFDTLKALAAEINGLSTSDPLPAQVIFKGLTLDFAISKNGETKDHSVKMQAISCIGDVSNLMSNEFGFIIASLRELSRQVADLAQKTNERCVEAFKDWEKTNKTKQVVADGTTVAEPTTTAPSAAPVTFQPQ